MSLLKDLAIIEYGKGLPEKVRVPGRAKVYGSAGESGSHKEALYDEPIVVVGRKGNISGVHRVDGPSWVIDTAYAIKAGPELERDYLYYYLKFNTSHLAASDQSTAIPSLAREVLYNLQLVLPSREKQIRIVNKITAIFSEIDAGVEELKKAKLNLNLYKQSVLNAAIQGKLIPQDPNDEPASKLLERIRAEKDALIKAGKLKKEKPLRPIDPSEIPFELPKGWEWVRLGTLCSLVTSGSRGWADYYSESGSLFVRSQDINTDALVIHDAAHVTLPEGTEGTRTQIMNSDVLITITGANVCKTALVDRDLGEAYVSQHVGLIRVANQNLSPYVHLYLLSELHGRGILSRLAYGAGKPGLNLDNLRTLLLPIAPLSAMRKLVQEAIRLNTMAGEVLEDLDTKMKRASLLKQAVLKSAFEGTLL
ncbi:restriction endonuclease subunit S [Bdellovibrionota bacterium FG-2]